MKRVFTQTFCAVGAIIEKDGKIALVKESIKSKLPDAGKWNQPAGWLDIGENPIHGAKREVEEETGFSFTPTAILGIYSLVRKDIEKEMGAIPHPIKIILIGEINNTDSLNPKTNEIQEIKWFTPEEIYAMDISKLRDEDIKQEVKDYFAGKKYPLEMINHFIQKH